jgi:cyclase
VTRDHAADGPSVRELAAGTYAWLWPQGGWGETNCGLVLGKGEALLIDTPWDLRLAEQLLFEFAPLLAGRRLRLAVNTHSDGDHWWGNWALPLATEIVTAEPVLAAMRKEPAPVLLWALRGASGVAGRLPGRLGSCSRYLRGVFGPFRFKEVVLRYPDTAFRGRWEVTVGGRPVELLELGAAHTACDLAVYLPDAQVVFAGDLLFGASTPVMWHGPIERWVKVLDGLLELPASLYVPGHGAVLERPGVVQLRDYLSALGELLEREPTLPPEEVARRLVGAEAAWRRWLYPERATITAIAQRQQRRGEPPFSGPLGRLPGLCRAALAQARLEASCR